jgi:hypothetical protein
LVCFPSFKCIQQPEQGKQANENWRVAAVPAAAPCLRRFPAGMGLVALFLFWPMKGSGGRGEYRVPIFLSEKVGRAAQRKELYGSWVIVFRVPISTALHCVPGAQ